MRKFRVSVEPFYDLNIDKYVEYLGSDSISTIDYVDDLLPHTPLLPCSYWGYGIVFHNHRKVNC
jgi:hypothetical protein